MPVPCISRAASALGSSPPESNAARMTSCWEGPFGAVKLLERPSCMYHHIAFILCAPFRHTKEAYMELIMKASCL